MLNHTSHNTHPLRGGTQLAAAQQNLFAPAARAVENAEQIHPALWRASQLARAQNACLPTQFAELSAELPGGGWPQACLIEILLPEHGSAELQLLAPALQALYKRSASSASATPSYNQQSPQIALIQPPYQPYSAGLQAHGIASQHCLWIHAKKASDNVWACEQILRSACCAALLCWQTQIRSETLRRLHLAAQAADTYFFMMRPLRCAEQASPAPLRLQIESCHGGIQVKILKRRGAHCERSLILRHQANTQLNEPLNGQLSEQRSEQIREQLSEQLSDIHSNSHPLPSIGALTNALPKPLQVKDARTGLKASQAKQHRRKTEALSIF